MVWPGPGIHPQIISDHRIHILPAAVHCDTLYMLTDCRFDTSSIAVISYAGWGVAGTNVLFRLDTTTLITSAGSQPPLAPPPLHVEGTAPAPPASSALPAPTSDDGGSSSWRVIVGVTVGVGGALALATILTVVARWARQILATCEGREIQPEQT